MENYKEETIKSYNQHAREFSEKFRELTDLKRRHEFSRFTDLLSGKDVLDLGCGSGDHSDYFVKQGLNVTCIDISEEMINLCKEKKLNARVMDIENLSFDDKVFDGVWAVTSLLHVPKLNLSAVIDKLHQILRDKGILYVCVKEGKGEGLIKDKGFDSQRFFSFWEKEELLGLFGKKFSLIESGKARLGHTDFLQFFFRKI
ncbi:MAG: class I SAM-dependent methyltransferase [Nanoarchaeota archaeon]